MFVNMWIPVLKSRAGGYTGRRAAVHIRTVLKDHGRTSSAFFRKTGGKRVINHYFNQLNDIEKVRLVYIYGVYTYVYIKTPAFPPERWHGKGKVPAAKKVRIENSDTLYEQVERRGKRKERKKKEKKKRKKRGISFAINVRHNNSGLLHPLPTA